MIAASDRLFKKQAENMCKPCLGDGSDRVVRQTLVVICQLCCVPVDLWRYRSKMVGVYRGFVPSNTPCMHKIRLPCLWDVDTGMQKRRALVNGHTRRRHSVGRRKYELVRASSGWKSNPQSPEPIPKHSWNRTKSNENVSQFSIGEVADSRGNIERGEFQDVSLPSLASTIEEKDKGAVAPWDLVDMGDLDDTGKMGEEDKPQEREPDEDQSSDSMSSVMMEAVEKVEDMTQAKPVRHQLIPIPTSMAEVERRGAETETEFIEEEYEEAATPSEDKLGTNERKQLLQEGLAEKGIVLRQIVPGTMRLLCPECEGGSSSENSFALTIDASFLYALFVCHRAKCGFKGAVYASEPGSRLNWAEKFARVSLQEERGKYEIPDVELLPLNDKIKAFFAQRGISEEVLRRNRIGMDVGHREPRIAFPYLRDGNLVNIKYRTLDKRFSQVKGAEKILFGLDDVKMEKEIIVVEGEMDKLALNEAGIWNVVSVPDGAPSHAATTSELPPSDQDKKFSYLWNCREVFLGAEKIVFAVDNDDPGDALKTELARRIGIFRCWTVDWPTDGENTLVEVDVDDPALLASKELWFRKDANEVLMKDGPEMLKKYIENARAYPIAGLQRFVDHAQALADYYTYGLKDHASMSTGWPSLDPYYKVVPGELTIVTGIPNSGKSEFLDALAVNLALSTDMAITFCSMEKNIREHGRQLIEKYVGKPFFSGLSYTQGQQRLTKDELKSAILWIDAHFPTIISQKDTLPDMEWVLEMAKLSIFRYGTKGLVIDPYNELDHQRQRHVSETEYVSQMLAKVKRFAQTYNVHVWFVAHPRQMYKYHGEPPNLYDISGSAHFINKADCGLVIHRHWKQMDSEQKDEGADAGVEVYGEEDPQLSVRVLVRKMRNKTAGTVGECVLKYDPISGRYLDPLN